MSWPGNKKMGYSNVDASGETDVTIGMTNQQVYEYRDQKMKDHDIMLDNLLESVKRSKDIAGAIGQEAEASMDVIGRLDTSVMRNDIKVRSTTKRVKEIQIESSTKCMWFVICILVLLLLAVLVLAYLF